MVPGFNSQRSSDSRFSGGGDELDLSRWGSADAEGRRKRQTDMQAVMSISLVINEKREENRQGATREFF